MPDIQFPTADGPRTTLLGRLFSQFDPLKPDERPIPADLFGQLTQLHGTWAPLLTARRTATSGQSGDVSNVARAMATATIWTSHYFQVLNLAIRRGTYTPNDRALFGLPVATADLPDLTSEAILLTWLTNLAAGDAALAAAGKPVMANPSAAEVAAKGAEFQALLTARAASGHDKSKAMGAVEALRPGVDEMLTDIYAELKHRHRKLAPAAWRDVARDYGFRFTNHRGERPEGRYADTIGAGETREVYDGTFDPALRLRLRNTGLTSWEIALAPTADLLPPTRALRLAPGQELHCDLPELGNVAYQHLLIRNLEPDQQGAWEVEFDAHG